MNTTLSVWLQRVALAFCFLGFGIWEFIAPRIWTAYVPQEATMIASAQTLVFIHGVALTIAGLGILSGYAQRFFTTLSTLILLEICVTIGLQEGFTDIFIRDAALLLFSAAMMAQAFSRLR